MYRTIIPSAYFYLLYFGKHSNQWLRSSTWESTSRVVAHEGFSITAICTDRDTRLTYTSASDGRVRIWTFDSKADDLQNCAQLGGRKRNLPQDWLSAQILKPLKSVDAPNNFLDEVHSNSISAMVATNGVLFTASVDFSVCCWAKNTIKQKQNPGNFHVPRNLI